MQEVQAAAVAELPEVQILLVDLEILEELEQLTLEEAVAVVHIIILICQVRVVLADQV
jgi:hypothetical protein